MAENNVVERMVVEIRAEQAKLKKDLDNVKKTTLAQGKTIGKSMGTAIGSAMTKMLIAGGGILALSKFTGFLKEAVQLYGKQERAEKKLSIAFGRNIDGLKRYASALQRKTAYGDEDIIEAQSLIASFVKEEEAIKKATKATLDLASAKGMDLRSASDLVSKTLGSSTNALSRYGIAVEGAVGSQERLNSLVEAIGEKFGGQAEGELETYEGRVKSISNAWGDFKEVVGKGVIPILDDLMKGMKELGKQLGIFEQGFEGITLDTVIQDMKDAKAPIEEIRKMQALYLKDIEETIKMKMGPIGGDINKKRIKELIKTTQQAYKESIQEELYFKQQINQPGANEAFKKTAYEELRIREEQTREYGKQIKSFNEILDLLEKGKDLQNEILGISKITPWTDPLKRTLGRADKNYKPGDTSQMDQISYEFMSRMEYEAWLKKGRTSKFGNRNPEGYKGGELTYEATQQVKEATNQYNVSLDETKNFWTEIDGISQQAMGNLISDLTMGIQLFQKTDNFLANILNKMAQVGATKLFSGIATGLLSLLPGGSWLASLFKAEGGPVDRNRPYIVGEKGPEIFTPNTAGVITPNNQMGGGKLEKQLAIQNQNLVTALNSLATITAQKELTADLRNEHIVISYEKGSRVKNRLR